MPFLYNAFILLHIKISHLKGAGIPARTIFAIFLAFLLAFGSLQLFIASYKSMNLVAFIEALLYVFVITYTLFYWIRTWPKANKLLNKAGDYEAEHYLHMRKTD